LGMWCSSSKESSWAWGVLHQVRKDMSSCSQGAVPNQVPNIIFVVAILLFKHGESINWHPIWIRPERLVSTLNNQQCEMNTLSWGHPRRIYKHHAPHLLPDRTRSDKIIITRKVTKLNLLLYALC
jgi:hypothetical protein